MVALVQVAGRRPGGMPDEEVLGGALGLLLKALLVYLAGVVCLALKELLKQGENTRG